MVTYILLYTALFQLATAYNTVTKVDCVDRNAPRTGAGWDNKGWFPGTDNVTQDAPPIKKTIKVADMILTQKAVQNPAQHVAMLCEVRAPFVDINALFVKQEGNPAYKGEFGIIGSESQTWRRRWYIRSYVNGHGYRIRVQFFGSVVKGSEAKATGSSMWCGVVYPLFPNADSKGCEFGSEVQR